MGINIIVYELSPERVSGEFWSGYELNRWPSWDTQRYVGDKYFLTTSQIDFDVVEDDPDDPNCEVCYSRPKDFTQAMNWVRGNVPEVNWGRWERIFEEMKANPRLHFFQSY